MKRTNQVSLSAICSAVVIFNFTSCKYEEGPNLTLKSKAGRLSGVWDATKIANEVVDDDTEFVLEFDKDGNIKGEIEFSYTYYGTTYSYSYSTEGTWEWIDDKAGIRLITNEVGAPDDKDTSDFSILRLTNDELKFTDEDNDVYEFEKQD